MKIHIKKDFGNTGENLATEYLEKQGYTILERNFYCKQGEIDIIAKDKNEIVFIEVKSRTSKDYGLACEAVDYKKIGKITSVANHYLLTNNIKNCEIRFDVIEVYFNEEKINHIENAF